MSTNHPSVESNRSFISQIWQSVFFQRFWKLAGAVSIRVKVLGIVIGVIIVLGIFVIFQIRDVLGTTLSNDLEHQGIALAHAIALDARSLVQDHDIDQLALLLLERKAHYSSESHNMHVDYIVIQDIDGRVLLSEGQFDSVIGASVADHSRTESHPIFLVNNGNTIDIHSEIGDSNYIVRLGLSTSPVVQTVNQVSVQLLATTLVMIAVGFASAFFLTWILTRPILDLVSVTHAVSNGDFSKRVTRWADDEIGELATAFNQMTESLAQAQQEQRHRDQLREQYINGVIRAQENERQRIARELHDSTSQSLTSLLVGLQNLKQAETSDDLQVRIDELRDVVGLTLDEIRDISWRLRPRALDDLGLDSAIQNYVRDFQTRHNIHVDIVKHGLDRRLAPQLETIVYRIIQEGLTNIARHAKATHVSLIVTSRDNHLKIIIEDNGIGFDTKAVTKKKDSLGLHGIRERAGLLGGTLNIESQPSQGTSLFINLPYQEQAKESIYDE